MSLSAYKDETQSTVHTAPEDAKESRFGAYGIVPLDAVKTLDRKRIALVADATLDEAIDAIEMLFGQLQLCDACERPATRFANVPCEDNLDRPVEYACDVCQFSNRATRVRPTPTAEAIHRALALIAMLKERR